MKVNIYIKLISILFCLIIFIFYNIIGNHIEVIDLSRDLLIICDIKDISIWEYLLNHMVQNSQLRNFFVTLVIIRNKPLFLSLCRNQTLLSLIIKVFFLKN
jgi:hypothetical protein